MGPAVVAGMLAGTVVRALRWPARPARARAGPDRRGGAVRARHRARPARRSGCSCSPTVVAVAGRSGAAGRGDAHARLRPQPERARRGEHGVGHRRGPRHLRRADRRGRPDRGRAAGAGRRRRRRWRSSATLGDRRGLRFEHSMDAAGGARQAPRRAACSRALRALRRRPVLALDDGRGLRPGRDARPAQPAARRRLDRAARRWARPASALLTAALGLGGLFGAVFAMSAARPDRLILHPVRGAGLLGRADRGASGCSRSRSSRSRRCSWSRVSRTPSTTSRSHDLPARRREPGAGAGLLGVRGRGGPRARDGQPARPGAAGRVRARAGALAVTGAILPIVALIIYAPHRARGSGQRRRRGAGPSRPAGRRRSRSCRSPPSSGSAAGMTPLSRRGRDGADARGRARATRSSSSRAGGRGVRRRRRRSQRSGPDPGSARSRCCAARLGRRPSPPSPTSGLRRRRGHVRVRRLGPATAASPSRSPPPTSAAGGRPSGASPMPRARLDVRSMPERPPRRPDAAADGPQERRLRSSRALRERP